jgi:hypothetical protein
MRCNMGSHGASGEHQNGGETVGTGKGTISLSCMQRCS